MSSISRSEHKPLLNQDTKTESLKTFLQDTRSKFQNCHDFLKGPILDRITDLQTKASKAEDQSESAKKMTTQLPKLEKTILDYTQGLENVIESISDSISKAEPTASLQITRDSSGQVFSVSGSTFASNTLLDLAKSVETQKIIKEKVDAISKSALNWI